MTSRRLLLKLFILVYSASAHCGSRADARHLSEISEGRRPARGGQLTRPIESKELLCARHCSCALVETVEPETEFKSNLTETRCESANFSDLLTIDRRTQIIHISLPQATGNQVDSDEEELRREEAPAAKSATSWQGARDVAAREGSRKSGANTFRMPRLVQFDSLREIVIVNLRFEVCDSEVFKKGQRLLRFRLNLNRLSRLSRACLRHLNWLNELNLDDNRLEELESALFNSLLNLKSLSLANNLLTTLAAHQFANLTQLVSLNLAGNSFKSINLHLFEPMQNTLKLLLLANNQIEIFYHTSPVQQQPINRYTSTSNTNNNNNNNNNNNYSFGTLAKSAPTFRASVVFRNLVKLNVDYNKLERIKLLQLHRFYNVKFLSIRNNLIGSIRDKAFNGLKLIELNLSNNQLQSISKCAFCNSTIRRLVLASNNISLGAREEALAGAKRLLPAPAALAGAAQELPGAALLGAGANESAAAPNLVILSQSILSPLLLHLHYLDLSYNGQLGEQLEQLLEPLLNLEYLNLAAVGTGPYLASPSLFKNLQQLRYLNLSHNQLDQFMADTLEPLRQLQCLDLSWNRFAEFDESLFVLVDELSELKVIKLSQNPLHCSQCRITALHDWLLRSPIYNYTCVAPFSGSPDGEPRSAADEPASAANQVGARRRQSPDLVTYSTAREPAALQQPEVEAADPGEDQRLEFKLMRTSASDVLARAYLDQQPPGSELLADDPSIRRAMQWVRGLAAAGQPDGPSFGAADFCLRCEEPQELQAYHLHELAPGDFKFCPGAAPRLSASEPRIGLTLAVVIISVLICIIVLVIVVYRRKRNTYYPAEDTDQLGSGGAHGPGSPGRAGKSGVDKKQVFSVSSDVEMQYGDLTDYSSPPVSQSYESYDSQPEDEAYDEEQEDEDEDEDEELDEEEEDYLDDDGDDDDDDNVDEQQLMADPEEAAGAEKEEQQQQKQRAVADARSQPRGHLESPEAERAQECQELSVNFLLDDGGHSKRPEQAADSGEARAARQRPGAERSSSGPVPRARSHHTKRQSSAHAAAQVVSLVAHQVAWRRARNSGSHESTSAGSQTAGSPALQSKRQQQQQQQAKLPGGAAAAAQLARGSSGGSRHLLSRLQFTGSKELASLPPRAGTSGEQEEAELEPLSAATSAGSLPGLSSFGELESARHEAVSGGALVQEPSLEPARPLNAGGGARLRPSNSTRSALTQLSDESELEAA